MKDTLKTKVFSEYEYTSIRSEMISRIENINGQANTAIITLLSAWTIGFAFIVALVQCEVKFRISCIFYLIGEFVFLIPVFYFIPLAVKSGENIRQIASISAYIKVFYDYCSLKNNQSIFNWETSNNLCSIVNVDRGEISFSMKFYNDEYTILSSTSLLIYMCMSIYTFKKLILTSTNIIIVLYLLATISLVICGICAIILIHRTSCMKNAMMMNTVSFVNAYIDRAIELGLISKYERDIIKTMLDPNRYNGHFKN